MTTQSDIAQLNTDLATAYSHSGSAADLLAEGNTKAAELHMIAVAYAIASAMNDAAAIAKDVTPPPVIAGTATVTGRAILGDAALD